MATRKAFPLRISPELYEELRAWAAAEFRSVNGQIEFLLRDAVRRRLGAGSSASPAEPPPQPPPDSSAGDAES